MTRTRKQNINSKEYKKYSEMGQLTPEQLTELYEQEKAEEQAQEPINYDAWLIETE